MTYCTQAQLIDRYGQQMLVDLTDRGAEATGEINAAVVTSAVAGAEAMINGYLEGRYALPLATVPELITELAQAIAIWRLHVGIPGEKIALDYKDARATLADIGKGAIRLTVAGVTATGAGESGAMIVDRERPLTEASMKGFI